MATFSAMVMVLGVLAVTPAGAGHIPPTGPVPSNCVSFEAGEVGVKNPPDYPGVSIELVSWNPDGHEPDSVTFKISGLADGEYVDISIKAATVIEESGPFGNGTYTVTKGVKHAISHIRLCVFEEGVTTTTASTATTTTLASTSTSSGPSTSTSRPGGGSTTTTAPGGGSTSSTSTSTTAPGGGSTSTTAPEGSTTTSTISATTITSGPGTSTTAPGGGSSTTAPGGEGSTTVPESTSTTVEIGASTVTTGGHGSTATSIDDEVLGLEILPFTGSQMAAWSVVAVMLILIGWLAVHSALETKND